MTPYEHGMRSRNSECLPSWALAKAKKLIQQCLLIRPELSFCMAANKSSSTIQTGFKSAKAPHCTRYTFDELITQLLLTFVIFDFLMMTDFPFGNLFQCPNFWKTLVDHILCRNISSEVSCVQQNSRKAMLFCSWQHCTYPNSPEVPVIQFRHLQHPHKLMSLHATHVANHHVKMAAYTTIVSASSETKCSMQTCVASTLFTCIDVCYTDWGSSCWLFGDPWDITFAFCLSQLCWGQPMAITVLVGNCSRLDAANFIVCTRSHQVLDLDIYVDSTMQ